MKKRKKEGEKGGEEKKKGAWKSSPAPAAKKLE